MLEHLEQVTKEFFTPHVGTPFHARLSPQETVELTLSEVVSCPNHNSPRREPFSLVFRGPLQTALPQRIYELEHEKAGPMQIFLTPVCHPDDVHGALYEAVFN